VKYFWKFRIFTNSLYLFFSIFLLGVPTVEALGNISNRKNERLLFASGADFLVVAADHIALHAFAGGVAEVNPLLFFNSAEIAFVGENATSGLNIVILLDALVDFIVFILYFFRLLYHCVQFESLAPAFLAHLNIVSFP
jgi:hypothetical protein